LVMYDDVDYMSGGFKKDTGSRVGHDIVLLGTVNGTDWTRSKSSLTPETAERPFYLSNLLAADVDVPAGYVSGYAYYHGTANYSGPIYTTLTSSATFAELFPGVVGYARTYVKDVDDKDQDSTWRLARIPGYVEYRNEYVEDQYGYSVSKPITMYDDHGTWNLKYDTNCALAFDTGYRQGNGFFEFTFMIPSPPRDIVLNEEYGLALTVMNQASGTINSLPIMSIYAGVHSRSTTPVITVGEIYISETGSYAMLPAETVNGEMEYDTWYRLVVRFENTNAVAFESTMLRANVYFGKLADKTLTKLEWYRYAVVSVATTEIVSLDDDMITDEYLVGGSSAIVADRPEYAAIQAALKAAGITPENLDLTSFAFYTGFATIGLNVGSITGDPAFTCHLSNIFWSWADEDALDPTLESFEGETTPAALFLHTQSKIGKNDVSLRIYYQDMYFTGEYTETSVGGLTIKEPVFTYTGYDKYFDVTIPAFTSAGTQFHDETYPANVIQIDDVEIIAGNDDDIIQLWAAVGNGSRLLLGLSDKSVLDAMDVLMRHGNFHPFPCHQCFGTNPECEYCGGKGFWNDDWRAVNEDLVDYAKARGLPTSVADDVLRGLIIADSKYLVPTKNKIKDWVGMVYDLQPDEIDVDYDTKAGAGAIISVPEVPGPNSLFDDYTWFTFMLERKEPAGGWLDWSVKTQGASESFSDPSGFVYQPAGMEHQPMYNHTIIDAFSPPIVQRSLWSPAATYAEADTQRMLATYDFIDENGVADGALPAEITAGGSAALEPNGDDGYQVVEIPYGSAISFFFTEADLANIRIDIPAGRLVSVSFRTATGGSVISYTNWCTENGTAGGTPSGIRIHYSYNAPYWTVRRTTYAGVQYTNSTNYVPAAANARKIIIEELEPGYTAQIAGINLASGWLSGKPLSDTSSMAWAVADDALMIDRFETSGYLVLTPTLDVTPAVGGSAYRADILNGSTITWPAAIPQRCRLGFSYMYPSTTTHAWEMSINDRYHIEVDSTASSGYYIDDLNPNGYVVEDFSHYTVGESIRSVTASDGASTWDAWTEDPDCSFTAYVDGAGRSWGRLVDANAAAGITPVITFDTAQAWTAATHWIDVTCKPVSGDNTTIPRMSILTTQETVRYGVTHTQVYDIDNATTRTLCSVTIGRVYIVRITWASNTTHTITVWEDGVQVASETYTNYDSRTWDTATTRTWQVFSGVAAACSTYITDIRASWLLPDGVFPVAKNQVWNTMTLHKREFLDIEHASANSQKMSVNGLQCNAGTTPVLTFKGSGYMYLDNIHVVKDV